MSNKTLYIFNPGDNISPFDVTMAADAGYSHIIPFANVQAKNVKAMVQDAIFARPPQHFYETGIFIGGRDVHLAADMFEQAKNAMVEGFQVGIFADPNGAYTTSASILALVQKTLKDNNHNSVLGRKLTIFGTGPVGLCTAVLAAKEGAKVRICQLIADEDESNAQRFFQRYQVSVESVSVLTSDDKIDVLQDTEVLISVAKAGVRILDQYELDKAGKLLVVVDSNAVPPSGVEGIDLQALNLSVNYAKGTFSALGALAIGQIKAQTELGLFKKLQDSNQVASIDFLEAYEYALTRVNDNDLQT